MVRKIIYYITWPVVWVRDEIRFRKKLKELRKKDPFIYK
jgi:hypothetical protein